MDPSTARERALWRSVAVPSEHGGWGLTLEPVLLGLLVAPSIAGVLLGLGALLAFLIRTPLKLVAVDLRRDRWLPRTLLAARLAAVELVALLAIAVTVTAWTGWQWWIPVLVAVPLVAVQLWFDVRSRSRRAAPELSGAIGVCAAVAAIALAGGEPGPMAAALWMVLAARAVGAIPFVRTQIVRLRLGAADVRGADLAQGTAATFGALAVTVEPAVWLGFAGLVGLSALQFVWLRRPPVPAMVLGMRQMILGLALVALTATGVALS